jgi:hypothetical protein
MEQIKIDRDENKEMMQRQETYIRSLGISLEDIKDQNNEIKEIKRRLSIIEKTIFFSRFIENYIDNNIFLKIY